MLPVLCEYVKENKHDSTIIAGNVVLDVLPQEKAEALQQFHEFDAVAQRFLSILAVPQAQQLARQITNGQPFDVRHLRPFAQALTRDLSFDRLSPKIREDAKIIEAGFEKGVHTLDVKETLEEALKTMYSHYESFAKALSEFPGNVYTLPGSFDGKHFDNFLKEKNLHLRHETIDGLVIAGYGSGTKRPKYIPHELLLEYKEDKDEETGLYLSLAVSHFMRAEPDIIVSHVPPHCMSDWGIPADFETGALEDYLKKMGPAVVLTGQVPGIVGADLHNPHTVTIYPGSLGANGDFCSIYVDKDAAEFREASFYRITDKAQGKESIKLVKKYMRDNDGLLKEIPCLYGLLEQLDKKKSCK